ncbi:hypothetical protein E2C01_063040 [Portunus trituberculatus]|uniref:Uncharacterized protein n=1 Tax=Portunus trituberculatus TaxID=210409 RepID=A0A5B7H9G1_PORTR|nr:hypothetical protein [Portunus trituberculatus]
MQSCQRGVFPGYMGGLLPPIPSPLPLPPMARVRCRPPVPLLSSPDPLLLPLLLILPPALSPLPGMATASLPSVLPSPCLSQGPAPRPPARHSPRQPPIMFCTVTASTLTVFLEFQT